MAQFIGRLKTLIAFIGGQGGNLLANVAFGLLCMRLLPAEDYAKFVVVYGLQATLLILMDANFSGTLIPLVGDRVENRRLVAGYIASLRQITHWAYGCVVVLAIVGIPFLLRNRHWGAPTVAIMTATVLADIWFIRLSAGYGAVLTLYRDRAMNYKVQLAGSVSSLVLLLLAWKLGWLNAFVAMWLNLGQSAITGGLCYLRSRKLMGGTAPPDAEKRRAIVRLAAPKMPQSFFFAVQGQLSLFLITYLGRAKGIAGVGALGRLGQLFAIFQQANYYLVEPYFAKLPKNRLPKAYALAVLAGAGISAGIAGFVIAFPQVVLWLLGPQYSAYGFEIKLSVISGAIACFSGVLWTIHSARRFVFWWSGIMTIVFTLLVQVLFILKANMGTVRGVLWLNLANSLVSLGITIATGCWGFWKGPREAERNGLPPQPMNPEALPGPGYDDVIHGLPLDAS
jgi:hypothetical protein